MGTDVADTRRVRFYGVHDLATGLHLPRVVEVAEAFEPGSRLTDAVDAIELHNVQQYLENGLLPKDYGSAATARARALIPKIESAVARFFRAVEDENFAATVADVTHEYHADLLDLLARNRAFERCKSEIALPALKDAGVRLRELLACKKLVNAYDSEIRDLLCASLRGAEYIVRRYLEADARDELHLPSSLTREDSRDLLERYIDSDQPNGNYVALIASANDNPAAGIDAKLRLRAKRRNDALAEAFFAEGSSGMKFGTEIRISDDQREPVVIDADEMSPLVARYTYGRSWLEATVDYPSVLNNFQHLFEFADQQVLLTLPSYPAHLGVMERYMGVRGKDEYRVGVEYRNTDLRTLLQTRVFHGFLEEQGVDLEDVLSWFFTTYLASEFGASGFSFSASQAGTPLVLRVRHLFIELESAAHQFSLWAEEGEIDRDLLSMGSENIRYRDLPSLLEGKYLYPTDASEIQGILHVLFSDQSSLTYIDDTRNADTAASLLVSKRVEYSAFERFQLPLVDELIKLGVLEDTGTRVQFASLEQAVVLKMLFETEAASYYRLSTAGRLAADAMIERGWAERRSTLLTESEAQYFNYTLNGVDFSNGPRLRNRYLHGSQANADSNDAHLRAYISALRLAVALVIKVNEDFVLADIEALPRTAPATR